MYEENEKNCKNLREGHTYDRVKMYNQEKRDRKENEDMLSLFPPAFTTEKCKYCKKGAVMKEGGHIGEWVCPVCGKTNRKKPRSCVLL